MSNVFNCIYVSETAEDVEEILFYSTAAPVDGWRL